MHVAKINMHHAWYRCSLWKVPMKLIELHVYVQIYMQLQMDSIDPVMTDGHI